MTRRNVRPSLCRTRLLCAGTILFAASVTASPQGEPQQVADPNFKPAVTTPTHTSTHPTIVLDEAHRNFHTLAERYKPFGDLLTADGYRVEAGTKPFSAATLKNAHVLVIANALGTEVTEQGSSSAFTAAECDAVRDWVRSGGALLLIADHTPFGSAAADLASRFDVEMGKGYAWDLSASRGGATTILYSRENGRLGEHAITQGVSQVVAFTGQSLSVPPGGVALMMFGDSAHESPNGQAVAADIKAFQAGAAMKAARISGRAQGIALTYGRGRVVMTGEAGMFSAQVVRIKTPDGKDDEFRFGMNVEGQDNQRLLLNILRWLSRAGEQ